MFAICLSNFFSHIPHFLDEIANHFISLLLRVANIMKSARNRVREPRYDQTSAENQRTLWYDQRQR